MSECPFVLVDGRWTCPVCGFVCLRPMLTRPHCRCGGGPPAPTPPDEQSRRRGICLACYEWDPMSGGCLRMRICERRRLDGILWRAGFCPLRKWDR